MKITPYAIKSNLPNKLYLKLIDDEIKYPDLLSKEEKEALRNYKYHIYKRTSP